MSQPNLLSVNPQKELFETSFAEWKIKLDCKCCNIFGTTTENLPDMPYRYMYLEQVEDNLIIQRLQTVISSNG